MKLGIIREGKTPSDSRVVLSPKQCRSLLDLYPQFEIKVQPSDIRCFTNEEYNTQGIELNEDVSDCDVLLGIKEVPQDLLIPEKTYFFFSHTIKKQEHNRQMLKHILASNIRLIDWETLTDSNGHRVIAFGRWAGIVGAHNGILTWLNRIGKPAPKPMNKCKNMKEAIQDYQDLELENVKIVLTGDGRVSSGAVEVLELMNIRNVNADEFLHETFHEPVFTQLNNSHMFYTSGSQHFDNIHYHQFPELYRSKFLPYTKVADVMINGIYWDARIPKFFSLEDVQKADFAIKVIADITCDIAPNASIPCTIRASTIANPVYGFDKNSLQETITGEPNAIDIMAVDNLPNELPRDASKSFGEVFIDRILPALLHKDDEMLQRATIAQNGKLTSLFSYLEDYVNA